MTIALYVNIAVALLLIPTLIYSALLNRRLSALRSSRAELEVLIQQFNDSCMRAEAGVRSLRTATDEAVRLQQYLERSQSLRDDLSYLLDRGGTLADRLEGGVRSARDGVTREAGPREEGKLRPVPSVVHANEQTSLARPATSARFSERAVNGEAAIGERAVQSERVQAVSERRSRSEREAPRERPDRAALRQALAGVGGGAEPSEEMSVRSKAERELLQALRSRR